ncbi:putative oxidoreductase -like protein [Trichinella pseudospiralis]|uniref:BLOC-1-related complex subunit 7 n=1 Tax=Trichinella pseudospiralis TaxID=6337 RepID=A0A0V1JZG4_TRIPS|nr:putative oxidoreductase -like protein [Trichinella pseudospiralis]
MMVELIKQDIHMENVFVDDVFLKDNLCKSSVTGWDIYEALKDYFKFDANNCHLLSLTASSIGEHTGFLSYLIQVQLQWACQQKCNSEVVNLPNSVIVKMLEEKRWERVLQRVQSSLKGKSNPLPVMHNVECTVYKLFTDNAVNIPVPKCYACWPVGCDKPPIIIMEDLNNDGKTVNLSSGLKFEQLLELAGTLAQLHAWSLTTDVDWKTNLPTSETLLAGIEQYFDNISDKVDEIVHSYSQYFSSVNVEKVKEMLNLKSISKMLDCNTELVGEVLVHGDLWVSNIFFFQNDDGLAGNSIKGIIDWQFAHRGSFCNDLRRLFDISTCTTLRRKYMETVLQFYYNRLKSFAGDKLTVSYLQVKNIFETAFAYTAVTSFVFLLEECIEMLADDEQAKHFILLRLAELYEDGSRLLDVLWKLLMPRRLSSEGKSILEAKAHESVSSFGTALSQIIKSSHSSEILNSTIRCFVQHEACLHNSISSLKQLDFASTKLISVLKNTAENTQFIDKTKEQLDLIESADYWLNYNEEKEEEG